MVPRIVTGKGITGVSRYVLGEDRMIRLRRLSREDDGSGTFCLLLHGSAFTGGAADHLDIQHPQSALDQHGLLPSGTGG